MRKAVGERRYQRAIAQVAYGLRRNRIKQPAPVPFHEGHFDATKLQAAYPGWREEDVKALIRQTPRADHEFEYEPLTGFRERPHHAGPTARFMPGYFATQARKPGSTEAS